MKLVELLGNHRSMCEFQRAPAMVHRAFNPVVEGLCDNLPRVQLFRSGVSSGVLHHQYKSNEGSPGLVPSSWFVEETHLTEYCGGCPELARSGELILPTICAWGS